MSYIARHRLAIAHTLYLILYKISYSVNVVQCHGQSCAELQGSRSNDCIAYVQALQYLHFGFRPNAGSNLYRLCFS